jgi:hypothetical protein
VAVSDDSLEDIQAMLESGQPLAIDRARAVIRELSDPAVDEWLLDTTEVARLATSAAWLWKYGEHAELQHRLVETEDILAVLARAAADSPAATRVRDATTHLVVRRSHETWAHAGLDIGMLGGLPSLRSLWLHAVDPPNLYHWRELVGDQAVPVTGLHALRRLDSLDELVVVGGADVDLREVVGTSLQRIELVGCTVDHVEALHDTEISELVISHSSQPLALDALPPTLRRLRVEALPGLTSATGLSRAHAIEEVIAIDCPALATLDSLRPPVFGGAPLSRIKLRLPALTSIEFVARAEKLIAVDLAGCTALRSIAPLGGRTLVELSLAGCASLPSLAGFPVCYNGTHLDLSGCEQIVDLAPIVDAPRLRSIDLRGLSRLVDASPIAALPDLRIAALWGTGVSPRTAPAVVRALGTWAHTPVIGVLKDRPR